MFEKLKKLLDGKKTVIGSILLIASGLLEESSVIAKVIYIAGSLLAGTGIVHKKKKREI